MVSTRLMPHLVHRLMPAAALGLVLTGQASIARTLEVGNGKEYKLPSDAIAAAKTGDVVQIQPGEYFDCATVRANRVVIEGMGDPSKVVITDKACGGKGLLITTGNDITVRNLTLTRARVPDNNGAGIRSEAPNLTVDGVRFINNQNGILAGSETPGTLTVRNSLFERNGACIGGSGCAHGIYASAVMLLHVEGSTFIGTKSGHHIKSRAQRTEVIDCTITDGPEGTSSYLIEAPNGGTVIIRGNKMEKGPESENRSAAIVIGAEGITQPTREILIDNNVFRNDSGGQTMFVNNLTATEAVLTGNKLSGPVKPLGGDGKVR